MEQGHADAHLDAALNPALLEGASGLNNTLLQEGGSGQAAEADAAATAAAAVAATHPILVSYVVEVDVARFVVARWRAFVAERKGLLLLLLLDELPDLFFEEVLKRLTPFDRTMLAQVGRPWLAAVLASGLPRLPKRVSVRLRLREFCTSAERLAWARANGCPWGRPVRRWRTNPCALAAEGGHLEALQWARQHYCPWDWRLCRLAAAYTDLGNAKRCCFRSMVRKAASFSMIQRDPKEKYFLGSSTWRSDRAFNVRTSRDLGNAKSCCFTIQPITALNFIFLLSH
jgi:hypothetical protein